MRNTREGPPPPQCQPWFPPPPATISTLAHLYKLPSSVPSTALSVYQTLVIASAEQPSQPGPTELSRFLPASVLADHFRLDVFSEPHLEAKHLLQGARQPTLRLEAQHSAALAQLGPLAPALPLTV